MTIVPGRVVNGRVEIEVEDFELPEGAEVTVYLPGEDEADFDLTPEQEAELEESIAEADRGEVIPAEHVLRELREMTAEFKRQRGQ
jgi:hypothetical protein